jgi:hypothetical protein
VVLLIAAVGSTNAADAAAKEPESQSLQEDVEAAEGIMLAGGIMMGVGIAVIGTGWLITHSGMPDKPTPPSSADASSSRWSAGPTALGDGFQLGWSSTW